MIKNNINKLRKNKEFSKYLKNTSWLFGEKILRIFFAFFINIWLARYLGPENFGFLAYGLSLLYILKTLTHLGLDGLVVKEIVNSNDIEEEKIIKTVFFMKSAASLVAFFIYLIIIMFSENIFSEKFWLLITLSFIILFTPFDVINYWFNAKVLGKLSSISFSFSVIVSSIIKVLLILAGVSFLWFGMPVFFEIITLSLCFIFFFNKKSKNRFNVNFSNVDFDYAKKLMSQSWKIMFGAIFAVIYLKVDQVMLETMKGSAEVGVYAVAAQLSELWYFVPTVIVTSIFPKLIGFKRNANSVYIKRLQQIFDFLFTLAFILSVSVYLIAENLILHLYGEEYLPSAQILIIHIWASIFIFMRALFSKWILIEDVLMFSFLTQGFGALSNVVLNYILIPEYGAYGAAIATLLSYATASYICLILYSKTRKIFWMMTEAMLSPVKYPYLFVKAKFAR